MFLIQKKLEHYFFYRAWTLVRAVVYFAFAGMAVRTLAPAAMHSHWAVIKEQATHAWPFVAVWFVLELVVEKLFTWFHSPRPKKLKKGEKPQKVVAAIEKRGPKPRVFYRRATMFHLLPGRSNPLLIGLSEQDTEFQPVFRAFLALRYALLCSAGLVTILLIAAEPIPRHSIEGIVGALIPYLSLKGLESFLLYLTLGRVMSGEDIHGARTTRFFAFEPSASFLKRLTLPVLDRKPWFVSLHTIVNVWYRIAWWGYRFGVLALSLLMAQAAAKLKRDMPTVITPALAICLPVAIFYLGLVLERTMAYLIFFPKQKKKKKAKAESEIPLQNAG